MSDTFSTSSSLPHVSRQPLYMQIYRLLLDRILAGFWKPGEKITSEQTLAAETGVSLGTLRKAVEMLTSEGILERRAGLGTYVSTFREKGYWNRFLPYETMHLSERYDLRRLIRFEHTPADEETAKALSVPPGTDVIHIVRHMIRGELVAAVDECFLLPAYFPHLSQAFFLTRFREDDTVYGFYDREFGIVITRQRCRVTCETISPDTSRLLGLEVGRSMLRLARASLAFGHTPVEFRVRHEDARTACLCFDL